MLKASEINNTNDSFGCVMFELDIPGWPDIISKIDIEDLSEKGLEEWAHCTVLYGIHDWDEPTEKVKKLIMQFEPPEVELGKISLFQNENFDVVKIDVDSSDLAKMNKYLIDNLHSTVKFQEYHAHVTIAYVKPGAGKKYEGMNIAIPQNKLTLKKVVYSTSEKKKTTFYLKDNKDE